MDIMMEERKHFIEGSEELNIPGCVKRGISEDIAGEIYDQMIDFAKYAFNKSHAAAYAAITMQTAYLKANYPLEFMAGLLSSVVEDSKKLIPYMAECRKMGIDILPPDLNKSGLMFEVEGENIRYALLAIKGVGESDLKRLINCRTDGGDYRGITEILERTSDNSSVFAKGLFFPLIKAGAFDFTGYSRKSLLDNVEDLVKKYKRHVKEDIQGQISLFEYMGIEVDEDGIEDNGEYDKKDILAFEKESLGTYISGHPLEDYIYLTKKYASATCADVNTEENEIEYENTKYEDGDDISIASLIANCKKVFTKKDQKPMAILTVEDITGDTEVVVFPNAYDKYKDLLQEGNKILIKGVISDNGEKLSIIANEIFDLDSIRKNLWILFDSDLKKESSIEQIKELINNCKGNKTLLVYSSESNSKEILSREIDIDKAYESLLKHFDRSQVRFN